MNRRSFLNSLNSTKTENNELTPKKLTLVNSLTPYEGTWDKYNAKHLLNRALFGFTKSQLDESVVIGLNKTIEKLFSKPKPTIAPINNNMVETVAKVGYTWVGLPTGINGDGARINSLRAWWFGNIVEQGTNIHEKMVLFWHNHFATEMDIVRDSNLQYKLNIIFRENATSNFKTLAKKITIDGVMLTYLNGNTNIAKAPNENYARELFELFTVGKGPLISEDNYTNYTESDIKQAAKVLTGWTTKRNAQTKLMEVQYDTKNHSKEDKVFSSIFGNKVIKNNEAKEYEDLIDMIFNQDATAIYICKKLYRWFVYYNIDAEIEQYIIKPLAEQLKKDNFEVSGVIKTLLTSQHFFSDDLRGAMIKPPIDFLTTLISDFNIPVPNLKPSSKERVALLEKYNAWFNFYVGVSVGLDQILGDPPSVAGWPAYYQTPNYYQLWLSSVTATNRLKTSDLITTLGYKRTSKITVDDIEETLAVAMNIDFINYSKQFASYKDLNQFIIELTDFLLPIKLTTIQVNYLKTVTLGDVPEYTWTEQWTTLESKPNDTVTKKSLETKISNLLKTICSMAEYQLM
jgi:uncharacterized protein (DUF1800 family)